MSELEKNTHLMAAIINRWGTSFNRDTSCIFWGMILATDTDCSYYYDLVLLDNIYDSKYNDKGE